MKIRIFIIITIIFVLLHFSCTSGKVIENDGRIPTRVGASSEPDDDTRTSKKVGAPEEIPLDSDQAVAAYDYVKEELAVSHPHITLKAIQKAFSQVVAGYTIILVCTYQEGDDPVSKLVYVKVYNDLEQNRSIEELSFDYIPD